MCQSNLYVYVGNDPVNLVDPSGRIGSAALAGIGVSGGAGIMIDLDNWANSGVYATGGPGLGLSVGGSAVVGVCEDIDSVAEASQARSFDQPGSAAV